MTDIVPGTPAPSADAPAPTPAPISAPAPTPPAATPPTAPQPINSTPPATTPTPPEAKTPEQVAEDADTKEWEDAEAQLFPGLKSRNKQEPKANEPAKSEKTPEEIAADEAAAKDQKQDAQPGAGDDAAKKDDGTGQNGDKPKNGEAEGTNPATPRATARQLAEQKAAVVNDIRTKMFADLPQTLVDADGDPIKGPEDVMKLIDPSTITTENPDGTTFTEERAYAWFLENNRRFKETQAQIAERVDQIAELHLDIKDQADIVNAKYGEWLKAHPKKRDEIWADFDASFTRDPESGIIIGMAMQLDKYYDNTVGPLVTQEPPVNPAATEAEAQAKAAADAKAKADAEAAANAQRQKDRADRSDIYQPPADPKTADPEEDEWDQAHKTVFPGYQPKK